MSQETIDYEAVIADLEAKRAALDAALSALRLVLNTAANVPLGTPTATAKPINPESIPGDAFFGLSIGEAAKKYLLMVRRKQSIREIADALDRGGLPHTSSNFANTVGTMLNRAAKVDSDLVRIGRGEWGLAAWYGNRRPKPEPTKAKRRKRHMRRNERENRASKLLPSGDQSGYVNGTSLASVRDLAEAALRDAGKPLHIDNVIAKIKETSGRGVRKDTLASMFSVTARNGDTFVKVAPGTFGLIG